MAKFKIVVSIPDKLSVTPVLFKSVSSEISPIDKRFPAPVKSFPPIEISPIPFHILTFPESKSKSTAPPIKT